MGISRSAGMNHRDAGKFLKERGFVQIRSKNHTIWKRASDQKVFTLPSSGGLNPWLTQQLKKLDREVVNA